MRLLQPVLRLPGLYQCRLVVRQAVDLFLPLGVAPLVPGFEDRRVPGRVEVRLAAEHQHRALVAADIRQAPRVHRAVHVADQVDQHFEFLGLRLGRQPAGLELGDERRDGRQHVAFGVPGHRFEGLALVDVQVVPRLGVIVFGGVAGNVHPVAIVHGRMAVEHLVDLLGGFGREVALCDVGRDVVPLLSPSVYAAGEQQA